MRALKCSITEPEVQKVFRAHVLAVDKKLKPEIIGLMVETNLVRAMAPPALYAAALRFWFWKTLAPTSHSRSRRSTPLSSVRRTSVHAVP